MRIRDNSILVLVMTTAKTRQKADILLRTFERTAAVFFFFLGADYPAGNVSYYYQSYYPPYWFLYFITTRAFYTNSIHAIWIRQ